jgi:hypothetical protein
VWTCHLKYLDTDKHLALLHSVFEGLSVDGRSQIRSRQDHGYLLPERP